MEKNNKNVLPVDSCQYSLNEFYCNSNNINSYFFHLCPKSDEERAYMNSYKADVMKTDQ